MQTKKRAFSVLCLSILACSLVNVQAMRNAANLAKFMSKAKTGYNFNCSQGCEFTESCPKSLISSLALLKINEEAQTNPPGYCDLGKYVISLTKEDNFEQLEKTLNEKNLQLIELHHLYKALLNPKIMPKTKKLLEKCIALKINNPEYAPDFNETGAVLILTAQTGQTKVFEAVLKKHIKELSLYYLIKAFYGALENKKTAIIDVLKKHAKVGCSDTEKEFLAATYYGNHKKVISMLTEHPDMSQELLDSAIKIAKNNQNIDMIQILQDPNRAIKLAQKIALLKQRRDDEDEEDDSSSSDDSDDEGEL